MPRLKSDIRPRHSGERSDSRIKNTRTDSGQARMTTPRTRVSALSAQTFDLNGKSLGTTPLPKELFGQKINKQAIAQAIRIYQTNLGTHSAHTKTRGEVRGGGIKPWRQKGTGRARAGSSRSPLWVGGGKTFGPKFRNIKLSLPQKMKRTALVSALSAKAKDREIKVIVGLEKATAKTKIIANLLNILAVEGNSLFIVPEKSQNLKLATRNIKKVSLDISTNLNAYMVFANKNLIFSKEAIEKFK